MINFGEPYINSFSFKRRGSLPPLPQPFIRLAWKVSRATRVVINQGIGEVNNEEGYIDVVATVPQVSYTLTAENEFGTTTRTLFSVDGSAPNVPTVITSTPFGLYELQGVSTEQLFDRIRLLFSPSFRDGVTPGMDILGGELRNQTQSYTADYELIVPKMDILGWNLRQLNQVYNNPLGDIIAGGENLGFRPTAPFELVTVVVTLNQPLGDILTGDINPTLPFVLTDIVKNGFAGPEGVTTGSQVTGGTLKVVPVTLVGPEGVTADSSVISGVLAIVPKNAGALDGIRSDFIVTGGVLFTPPKIIDIEEETVYVLFDVVSGTLEPIPNQDILEGVSTDMRIPLGSLIPVAVVAIDHEVVFINSFLLSGVLTPAVNPIPESVSTDAPISGGTLS